MNVLQSSKKDLAIELRQISQRLFEISFKSGDDGISSDCHNVALVLDDVAKRMAMGAVEEMIHERDNK